MSRRPPSRPFDLLTDDGVLDPTPVLEVFGATAVAKVGGEAILPHRGDWLRARESGLSATAWFPHASGGGFGQTVVHLQKGRVATDEAVARAWRRLDDDGRFLLVGGNDLGIKSAVKRLSAALGQPAEIIANRARARIACWRKTDAKVELPQLPSIEVSTTSDSFTLRSAPGVFSADAVDPGTAMLIDHLDAKPPPTVIFDPGCGVGVLALTALRKWPRATAVLADIDHRAVDCVRTSAEDLNLSHRCEIKWWDAVSEPEPAVRCDLVLLNPPFHSGVPVDLQPARSIFAAIGAVLIPGGRALIVANRTLPWEHDLRKLGSMRLIEDRFGYKVLEVTR